MGRGLLAAMVVLLAPPLSGTEEGTALLEKHLLWLGGRQALERVRDLTWSGTLTTAGLTSAVVLRETAEGWHRRELDLGPTHIVEVSGPEGGWVLNWTGQVEAMSPAESHTVSRRIVRKFGQDLLGSSGTASEDVGSEDREGQSFRVLRFLYAGGDHFDLFLDSRDGSCTWVREASGSTVIWTRLGDWHVVSGVRMPFDEQTFEGPSLAARVHWRAVKANEAPSAAIFARPMPRSTVAQISGGAPSTPWMEIELAQGRFVYVKGRVNDRETPILLDSGDTNTILSAAFARQSGLAGIGALSLQGATNAQRATLLSGIDIEIGRVRLSGVTVAITDLDGPEKAMGRSMPVILGKEVFNAFVVEIDYPRSRIRFHRPESFSADPASRSLRLLQDEGLRLTEASVEGLPPAPFIVDIAAAGSLTLFKAYSEDHGLLTQRWPRSQRLSRGAGGGSLVTVATLNRFTIGGFELRGVPADFYQGEGGAFDTERAAGNLGAGVLSRFRVVFDYSRDAMYLIGADGWDRAFCKNRVGLQADFQGSFLEVVFVAPGSPAKEAGWAIGDRITSIDGRPIGADYFTSRFEWLCGAVGSTVLLTDGQARERSLVLTDYY